MTKRRDIISIVFFFLLVLLVLGGLSAVPKPKIVPAREGIGVYDLSGFDFSASVQAIDRVGNWDSWPEKFYAPQDFTSGTHEPAQILTQRDYEKIQYATHRLRLILPPGKTYGISMKSSDYAMRIFINDEEIDSVGVPGTSKETNLPRTDDRVYYFTPQTENVDIIVQVSNFVHNDGCQPPRLFIGSYQNIAQKIKSDLLISFVIIGCLLTAGLYHLALFLLNRKRKTVLIFSVCCFLLILVTNKLIPVFFPDYNWYLAFQVEYIVHFLTFGMLTLFLDSMFSKLFHKWIARTYYILCGLFILTTFAFNTVIYSGLLKYFDAISVLMIVYILIRLAMALKDGKMQNLLAFSGMFIICLFGVNDILYHNNIILIRDFWGQTFTTPVGMMIFVFCYAVVLSVDYAETEQAMREAQVKERTLAADNLALDRLNQMKSDLMATVSHETRTPLAVLSGYAELIAMELRRKGVDAQTAKDLDQIADEIQRIAAIMEEMQNFSKEKANTEQRAWIRLDDIIRQSAKMYAPILERKKVTLTVTLPDGLPSVFANAAELTQVMFNLLQNARNHTENGAVAISASVGRSITVTVSDTGTGISAELLPRVLERGVSGDKNGTGFGLAICKEILHAHGGTINIESEPDKGTSVRFSIPISQEGGNYNENGLIG